MSERSEHRPAPLRLVLDAGESIELDGSTVLDPAARRTVPAVVVRMPAHRAAYLGNVLEAYTRVCRLAGTELNAEERSAAWALTRAAEVAGFGEASARMVGSPVTSGRKLAAGAVLRTSEDLDDATMIAVVEAAARWLEEPDGEEYAYALLGAVTDGQTQVRAYGELIGTGGQA
jgi:hypothetical protein